MVTITKLIFSVVISVSPHVYRFRLGVKRVTEPNRTEPPDYTGQSLRKFPILAVPGFTAVTEPNYLA